MIENKRKPKGGNQEPTMVYFLRTQIVTHDFRKLSIWQKGLNESGTVNFVGRDEYISLIDKLVFGDSPQEGILRGRNFYHEGLGFSMRFPQKWNMTNLPDRVLLTAADGNALMQISAEGIDNKLSPRNFMIQRMGLNNLEDEFPLNINGLAAHTGISVITNKQGSIPTRFTVIYFKQRAYIIAGMAKGNNLANYDNAILETAKSFHALTTDETILAKPIRINIVKANSKTRFSRLAKQSPLESHAESQLRLLNAKYPTGEPEKGSLIKVLK